MNAGMSYREAGARGAKPVRLVICLYEQMIEDLRRAVISMEKGLIEARTKQINHALMVIAQLESSLDLARGGEVAKNLSLFYSSLRKGLSEAQFRQSVEILQQQISQLMVVHEAWLEVERATEMPSSPYPDRDSDGGAIYPPQSSFADWSA